MATYEVTGEGLREAIETVRVPCQLCEERASKVMRCRSVKAMHVLLCEGCLAQVAAAIAEAAHTHCAACGDAGETLTDVAEILDI